MENQSLLKPLTFQRRYLLSETTVMVWKINWLPDFWSFVSNIYLYCEGQLDFVTTTANLLWQDADSSSTEGDEIWVGGKCFMLCAAHGLSRTSMINKKGIYSTKSVDLLFQRGGRLPVACCQLDARNQICPVHTWILGHYYAFGRSVSLYYRV